LPNLTVLKKRRVESMFRKGRPHPHVQAFEKAETWLKFLSVRSRKDDPADSPHPLWGKRLELSESAYVFEPKLLLNWGNEGDGRDYAVQKLGWSKLKLGGMNFSS